MYKKGFYCFKTSVEVTEVNRGRALALSPRTEGLEERVGVYTARRLPAPGEVMGLSKWAMGSPLAVLTPHPTVTKSPNPVSLDV